MNAEDRIRELLLPENAEELLNVFLYHIIPGEMLSTTFVAGSINTLLIGSPVKISVDPILFDDAGIVLPDVPSSNGVFNVLDTLLDPFRE